MTHAEVRERIAALLDGELEAIERQQVERHLAHCAACRTVRDETAALSLTLRSLPSEPMPEDLRADLMRRARDAGRGRAAWGALTRPWALASMASAVLLLVIAVIADRHGDIGTISPPTAAPGSAQAVEAPENDSPARGDADVASPLRDESAPAEPLRSRGDAGPDGAKTEEIVAKPRRADEPRKGSPPVVPTAPAPTTTPPEGGATGEAAGSSAALPPRAATGIPSTFATEAREQTGMSGPARFAMTLVRQASGELVPGLLAPPPRPAGTAATPTLTGSREPVERRLEPPAVAGRAAADADADAPAAGAAAKGLSGVTYDGPRATMVFLLRLDATGTVIAADPVGARLVPERTERALVALLIGSSIRPRFEDDPPLVALEVTFPGEP